MRRARSGAWVFVACVVALAAAVVPGGSTGAVAQPSDALRAASRSPVVPADASATASPIEHVIILMKENRSFDHYFGRFPGADGATTGVRSNGTVVPLTRAPDPMPQDVYHDLTAFQTAYNGGRLNGWDRERGAIAPDGTVLSLTQMLPEDIPNYWAYAQRYGLGDRMFSAFHGNSFPNNLYSVAGQVGELEASLGFRGTVGIPNAPNRSKWAPWGCDDPPNHVVRMADRNGAFSNAIPCFDFESMPDQLAANGIDWRMYGALLTSGVQHNALDADASVRYDPQQWANVRKLANFVSDVNRGDLPAVTWIAPAQNEHPPAQACIGENESVKLINAVMQSPLWANTVILIYWDEWGGFYDHVSPPQVNALGLGFRMPLLVISPWTKRGTSADGGFIDSTQYTQVSPLAFITWNWGLDPLNANVAAADPMLNMFDFAQEPKAPLVLTQRTCPPMPHRLALKVAEEPYDP